MDLRRWQPGDSSTVASWATTPAETRAWCSLDEVSSGIVRGWASSGDVEAWIAEADGELVAYGELWPDDDEAEVELAHIIVCPTARSAGVGRRFVARLVERALQLHPAATLRVVPDNHAAIAAYMAAGFERASSADEAAWNLGQPVDYVWMVARHEQT